MTSVIEIVSLSVGSSLLATVFSLPAIAAKAAANAAVPATVADAASAPRVAFDGNIRNNSLAVSPDEATAVVSYSERPDVVVYDLTTSKVRGVLHGYITPRNIVFAPDGQTFYVSDSSLGTVARMDTATNQARAVITGFAQPRQGLRLSPDGAVLYVPTSSATRSPWSIRPPTRSPARSAAST